MFNPPELSHLCLKFFLPSPLSADALNADGCIMHA